MASEIVITIISAIFIFAGFVGSVLPFLPGPPLALVGLIIYGYSTGFQTVSITAIIIFAVLVILSFALDIFAPALGAKGYKASKRGTIGAVVGAILGAAFFGPLGAVLGPFVGGFAGEYFKAPDAQKAFHTAWGALIGFVLGTVTKLVLVLAMAGYFVFALLT